KKTSLAGRSGWADFASDRSGMQLSHATRPVAGGDQYSPREHYGVLQRRGHQGMRVARHGIELVAEGCRRTGTGAEAVGYPAVGRQGDGYRNARRLAQGQMDFAGPRRFYRPTGANAQET